MAIASLSLAHHRFHNPSLGRLWDASSAFGRSTRQFPVSALRCSPLSGKEARDSNQPARNAPFSVHFGGNTP
jgi:hypothetical protein